MSRAVPDDSDDDVTDVPRCPGNVLVRVPDEARSSSGSWHYKFGLSAGSNAGTTYRGAPVQNRSSSHLECKFTTLYDSSNLCRGERFWLMQV
jgi:hypothetical protein